MTMPRNSDYQRGYDDGIQEGVTRERKRSPIKIDDRSSRMKGARFMQDKVMDLLRAQKKHVKRQGGSMSGIKIAQLEGLMQEVMTLSADPNVEDEHVTGRDL